MPRLFSLILFLSALSADEKPFVTCRISGQLANNLNQIATTLAYAWDNGADPFFPELNNPALNTAYNKNRFFFRLNSNNPPRPIQYIYDEYEGGGGWWDCKTIPFKPDQYLSGDFFCWRHFHHYRDKFIDLFAPSHEITAYIRYKYSWIIDNPKAVSVHVRTYNKQYHETIMKFLGLDYYEEAFEYFPDDALFVVFSDRINWCKQHFQKFNKKFVFIEDNDHVEDFQLMTLLKNHIISNSCYSWWAAYLSNHLDKTVIAPNRNGRLDNYFNDRLYLYDWILVDPNLNEPYPYDMKDYDKYSKSIDTQ